MVMSQAEYVLGFIAIVIGLAVADIAHSLHNLLRPVPAFDRPNILSKLRC
jgi:hypothetical protein